MSPLTVYLARFIGVAMLLMCGAFAARPKQALAAITSMMAQPGVILITGIFTLAGGAAMVVGHNLWSGGALTIAVTAIGWVTLLKGCALVALSPPALARLYRVLGYPRSFQLVMALGFLFSLWLVWAGFTAVPSLSV